LNPDIWEHKDIDDYLHYLSHEYRQFCMNCSLSLFDFLYWMTYYEDPEHSDIYRQKFTFTIVLVPIMLQVTRVAQLFVLKMQST
jgi:hypothetical protein